MKKKLLILLAALSLALGGLPGPSADALTVVRYCSDYASYGNRICYDFGAGYVYVYDTATHVYALATIRRPTADVYGDGTPIPPPTSGQAIVADSQCGTSGTFNGHLVTSWVGNGSTIQVFYSPSANTGYWAWSNAATVNASFVDVVAWMANSNTGYECISIS